MLRSVAGAWPEHVVGAFKYFCIFVESPGQLRPYSVVGQNQERLLVCISLRYENGWLTRPLSDVSLIA